MKPNSILFSYIIRELIPPFIMSLAFFMFVFLMRQVLEMTDLIVNYRVGFLPFLLMIVYSLPYFLVFIIPMSVMLGVLFTFLNMSDSNEITALKAGGVSPWYLLWPVMTFAGFAMVFTIALSVFGMPAGSVAYKNLAVDVVRSNFNIGLKENTFNDNFGNMMFFVRSIDRNSGELKGVFIEDSRKPGISSTVVAPSGYFLPDAGGNSFVLRLKNGMISQVELDKKITHAIGFHTYDMRIDISKVISGMREKAHGINEMRFSELLATAKKGAGTRHGLAALMELHRKFSIPFACMALALLAVPLGIESVTARKSAGLGIGLLCFLIYYMMISGGMALAGAGICSAALGMWAPDLIMGGLGIYLMIRTANDRPVGLTGWLGSLFFRIVAFFSRLVSRHGPLDGEENSG